MSFHANLMQAAMSNPHFRKELHTTEWTQVVVMSIEPGDDIGAEVHDLDQVLVFVAGEGVFRVGEQEGKVQPGDVVVVPAHAEHNFVNTGSEPLKLYTVYAPPRACSGNPSLHQGRGAGRRGRGARPQAKVAAAQAPRPSLAG